MEYTTTCPSYSEAALARKREIIGKFIEEIAPKTVWDLGANTGEFSRIVRAHAPDALTVAWDADPGCVGIAYRQAVKDGDTRLLPLVLDLTNPSPGLGWDHAERLSLRDRGPVDAVLALALVHHLVIGNNVPFEHVARFLGKLCRWLIIEFVPRGDPQVTRMLSTRCGSFPDYNLETFERGFSSVFTLRRSEGIAGSDRILFLMEATR
jgi:ribosomal protein L11 methylase PrmA